MSGDKDFLDEFEAEDIGHDAIVEQPTESEMEPAGSGRPRGPDGKFVKAEAEAKAEEVETGAKEAAGANHAEPPSDDEQEGQSVPFTALKAERKKRQELEERLAALEGKQTQPQSTPEFEGPSVDFYEDPQSYLQAQLHQQKMQMSTLMATKDYGQDVVSEAWSSFDQACKTDPQASSLSYALLNHPHPLDEVVKWYNARKEMSALQEAGGLEALKQKWLAEMQQQPQAQQGTQPRANVPPSLASSGKATSMEPSGVSDPFDELFS
jgi:hypothetical protein